MSAMITPPPEGDGSRGLLRQFLRFKLVTLLGLALDLTLAYSVRQALGWPLPLCAAIGFAAGAIFNYLAHEYWTFVNRVAGGLSARRFGRYILTVSVTLIIRIALVAAGAMIPFMAGHDLAVLVAAAGISFIVHFLLARSFAFNSKA